MSETINVLGYQLRPGGSTEVTALFLFRDWLMPVVAVDQDGTLKVNGSAVCIGPGTFVTARHVVDYLLDTKAQHGDAESNDQNLWMGLGEVT